jgi:hypothetical protein
LPCGNARFDCDCYTKSVSRESASVGVLRNVCEQTVGVIGPNSAFVMRL